MARKSRRKLQRDNIRKIVTEEIATDKGIPVENVSDTGVLGEDYMRILVQIARRLRVKADSFNGLYQGSTVREVVDAFVRLQALS